MMEIPSFVFLFFFCAFPYHYLFSLSDVTSGGDGGNETKLGMVEHHELSVGSEAVVTLVGQTSAVLGGGLGPLRYVDSTVRHVTWVVDPEPRHK